MALTEAQTSAIHTHNRNLIVIAGAGSGKTFVLVERYLALLDRHPEWPLNALVAITFTQKAAQEMRDRVRQHLQRQVDEARDEEAAEGWARRLAAMDSARIDTIHGLCAAILRGNAAEAGVDPGFAVLDEIEARVLLDDTIEDVFRSLDGADPLLELFAEYGANAVYDSLKELINSEFSPNSNDLFTGWLEQWVAQAHGAIRGFKTRLRNVEIFKPVGGDILSQGWQVCGAVVDRFGWQDEQQYLYVYLEQVAQIAALRMPGRPAGVWGDEGAAAKAAFKRLRDLASETLAEIGEPPGALDLRAARLIPLWMTLAQRVHQAYRAAKDERGTLDFDDLERLTRALLQDDGVRARYLGAEFKHVLVDEFQDTNAAQWAIIQRIADPAQPGCLFVVGDPKQSIYGFRGADVSVFEQVRGVITASGQSVDLNTSFRTHHRLLECMNHLFTSLLVREEGSPVSGYQVEFGGGMRAERIDAPSESPVLEFMLLDKERLKNGHQEEAKVGARSQREGDEDQAARRWEARAIARRIKQMVEAERRPIFDKQAGEIRPMGYGDVALLFQAMTHVTLYEAALKAENIPYLTVAGKGYYDRQEVWDLLNLLRALYNPADNLSLAAALRSPLFSLSDDALLGLRLVSDTNGKPIPLWEALAAPEHVPVDEIALVEFAQTTLYELRREAGRVTIAELLRHALEVTGYLAVLTGLPDGKRRRGNVEKLLEKAETSGKITLSAFTKYLQDMSENEAREGEAGLEGAGAVQLMTVHKSKGLEFPLVVLVDAGYQRSGDAGVVTVDAHGLACKVYDPEENKLVTTYAHQRAARLSQLRDSAERRRLLYVAVTRAQDYLLISGQVSCKANQPLSSKGWLHWLIEALELGGIAQHESQLITYHWGEARVDFPLFLPDGDESGDAFNEWDDDPAASRFPTLLKAVPVSTSGQGRSLTASQIADLGSARQASSTESRAYYAERWQRSVLLGAPGHIEQVQRAAPKKVGEIVHRAIHWALPEDNQERRDLLRRYAWEEGIVDREANLRAVDEAYALLERVRRSDVFAWIDAAREVYRELPFVYQTGTRTIHGVIDLLLRSPEGVWRLVDYKTSWLGRSATQQDLEDHARRYHLQMGIYAAAVQELVQNPPEVYIHYIRYAYSVVIHPADWNNAQSRLEGYVGDMIEHG